MNLWRLIFKCRLFVLLTALMLAGCASNPDQRFVDHGHQSTRPVIPPVAPVESIPDNDRVIVNGNVLPLPQEPRIAAYSLPEKRPLSPVVQNLVEKAQGQSRQGDFDNAANSLERALRIEPRNAMLWNRLADIRYLQKFWKKSIQLAAKSNTLSGGDNELRRENWYLMSNSYKALGNAEEEQKYRDKLIRQRN